MDLSKYKDNPKTAYIAKAVEAMPDDEQKQLLVNQMEQILAAEEKSEEFPNEAVLEVRAGVGGQEAALFAEELANMYRAYAAVRGWQLRGLSESKTDLGGYKEAVFELKGKGVYERLRFETGVHRVQRVPATEKSGRIHTSTASVAILPIRKKHTITINPADLELEFSRAGGRRRAKRQQGRDRGAHHTQAHGARCAQPGGALPKRQPRARDGGTSRQTREFARRARGGAARRGAQGADRHRRPQRKDTHL